MYTKSLRIILFSFLFFLSSSFCTTAKEAPSESYDFRICFAGDINLDENWSTTMHLNASPGGIEDCISPTLLQTMRSADCMCLNNEFTYSLRGNKMPGKAYTFRANPARVQVLSQMGVDLVKMANNHVYDYGPDALLDTFSTLQDAGIPYFGAGANLAEAMQPVYTTIDGKTVAFVGASRAEKNIMTPQATDHAPGILRCYDPTLFVQVIQEAKANADFVIAYVHWGTEYSTTLEQVQPDTAKLYIDAGADAIVGAHPHILQGMEFYNGKPILYSLGNFWFNQKTLDTMLATLHFSNLSGEDTLLVQLTPALQQNCTTTYVEDPAQQRAFYDRLEAISRGVKIDDNGFLLAQ